MYGLILNAHGPESCQVFRPGQQPLFYADADPIFEIWFWDRWAALWFVMVDVPARVLAQGAVGFPPWYSQQQLVTLRDQWRAYRAQGGGEPRGAA